MKLYETMTDEEIGRRMRAAMDEWEGRKEVEVLIQEVKPKKKVTRVATINTAEEILKAMEEWTRLCKSEICSNCRFYSLDTVSSCFAKYLAEEI